MYTDHGVLLVCLVVWVVIGEHFAASLRYPSCVNSDDHCAIKPGELPFCTRGVDQSDCATISQSRLHGRWRHSCLARNLPILMSNFDVQSILRLGLGQVSLSSSW
jgi:hypothetical protein